MVANNENLSTYRVTCSRTEEFLSTGEIFEGEVVNIIDADSEWCAIDELKHRIFYEAKKEGYKLKVNEPDYLVFVGTIDIYMSNPPKTIVKMYKFTDFKCTLTDC